MRLLPKDEKITAVILAAGYATRLYPLTLHMPKPLLRVTKDKTVIDFIVDELEGLRGIDEIIVVTNHRFYRDFHHWASRRRGRAKVVVLDDGTSSNEDRLGAIGDIDFAVRRRRITSDLLVVGGDNLFDHGFGVFSKFARMKKPFSSLGLFDIRHKTEATRFGVVAVTRTQRLSSFEEKPSKPKSTLVATCLYFFPAPTLAMLGEYMRDRSTSKDAPGNYIRWLCRRHGVYGCVLKKGHWHDIGHFDSYKEVVRQFNPWRKSL